MFLLFEAASQNLILGVFPESLGLLVFGIGLIFLAIGLRRVLKRSAASFDGDARHTTK